MREMLVKARTWLLTRRQAYQMVFNREQGGDIVLQDLAKFCRAHESTYDPDPRVHAVLEGRREVWLRICHHLDLNSEQLWQLYDGRKE